MKISVVNLGHVRFQKEIKSSTAAQGHSNNRAGTRVIDLAGMETRQGFSCSIKRGSKGSNRPSNAASASQFPSRISGDGPWRLKRAGNAAGPV